MSKVAIIMGSPSDKEKMGPAVELLRKFGVEVEVYCRSAHRAHDKLIELVRSLDNSPETDCIITGAGLSNALSGVVASQTILPVIGVPLISSADPNGEASLQSTVQMPPGIPVAAVGKNAAKNAAYLALRICARRNIPLRDKIREDLSVQAIKNMEGEVEVQRFFAEPEIQMR